MLPGMPSRSLPLLVLLAVLALSGCGGDDGFDGNADVPDGYATYRGDGRHVRPSVRLEADHP